MATLQFATGRLRHRVTILAPSWTTDEFGDPSVATLTERATVWANVSPLSGSELFEAKQLKSEVTHRVTIRYRNDVKSSDRIQFGTRTLDVSHVLDIDEKHAFTQLLCTEVVD